MRKASMKIAALSAAATAAALCVMLTPSAALAVPPGVPTGCSSGIGWQDTSAWSKCTGGSGSHRAVATCANDADRTRKVYGPWTHVGSMNQSSAICPGTHPYAVGHSYETRSA
ncbi:hypothetical protein GCM10022252_71510 [Streptosporangium oxazolinicum]|uniref:Secreted protein n=1 Tax=Streptosporangium oxazolinicum TaxID=909287 RepID=A0ABP8BIC5_9ACTN